jgi:hypothetical protein
MDPRFQANPSASGAYSSTVPSSNQRPLESDPVSSYFECITSCSVDDGECVTQCVEVLREQQ